MKRIVSRHPLVLALIAAAATLLSWTLLAGKESAMPAPDAANYPRAIFAAGCFWGIEAKFQAVDGVVSTRVGYTGGTTPDATYEMVCHGGTGHAEAVEVTYDPAKVTYDDLLAVFWHCHNPTNASHKGQYRSAIFTTTDAQATAAQASKAAMEKELGKKIVTQIAPAGDFWQAEDYHQSYYRKHGLDGAACAR